MRQNINLYLRFFNFGVMDVVWDLIVVIPDHCPFFYFELFCCKTYILFLEEQTTNSYEQK